MKNVFRFAYVLLFLSALYSCAPTQPKAVSAAQILGNAEYPAICYGGYRNPKRENAPTVEEIKEDVRILHACGFRVLRTYHARLYNHTPNLLQAISELKAENPRFEMYVMLGAWIQCENAWTANANHSLGDTVENTAEIEAAINLASTYPDIVKIIAVGNEAMVHWAAGYYVYPEIILKWVNHLQQAKKTGLIASDTWITSSDNFASWGGGDGSYHTPALKELIASVDYLSVHTYPFHDTHYNPEFWYTPVGEESGTHKQIIDSSVARALRYAQQQYTAVTQYVAQLGQSKPVHIGETGWATVSSGLYGPQGSRAADEYKQAYYYNALRAWTDKAGISCFFFEAFDEPWKDGNDPNGSENHFGLFTVDGKAKYAVWHLVEDKTLAGLQRGGNTIGRTMRGNEAYVLSKAGQPPLAQDLAKYAIMWDDATHTPGDSVNADYLVIIGEPKALQSAANVQHPSATLKLNAWDGTCTIQRADDQIHITTGSGDWWGCALELDAGGIGENLTGFNDGFLHFEVKGTTTASLQFGFQTGNFNAGNQVNAHVAVNGLAANSADTWQQIRIPIADVAAEADLTNVTALLYVLGTGATDGQEIMLRNIYWSRE